MKTLFTLCLIVAVPALTQPLPSAYADTPCSQDSSQQANQPVSNPNLEAVGNAQQAAKVSFELELETEAPPVTAYTIPNVPALEWEQGHPERKIWSEYAISVVNAHLADLDKAADMSRFCSNYPNLTHDQRVLAWAQLFVGVSKWESSWDPTERTLEDQGIDQVTHKQVYSEGLLQLSYQDGLNYQNADGSPMCKFDWENDRKLSGSDWHRTIFNPFNNLHCGITIMAQIVHDKHSITNTGDEGYWSTLDPHGSNGKIQSITSEIHKTLPFCGPPVKGAPLREDYTRFANLKVNRDIVKGYRSVTGKIKSLFERKSPSQPATPTPQPAQ